MKRPFGVIQQKAKDGSSVIFLYVLQVSYSPEMTLNTLREFYRILSKSKESKDSDFSFFNGSL